MELVWWVQAPVVCIGYVVVSKEPLTERLILAYLAFVSIAAMAVGYGAKGEAAKAKDEAGGG